MPRARTRSVVNTREYFREEMYIHDSCSSDDEEDWKELAWKTQKMSVCDGYSSTEDEEEEDESDSKNNRQRTCSHERRISFDDEVNVVTIPSRDTYDEEWKREMWYSAEEFDQMRVDVC